MAAKIHLLFLAITCFSLFFAETVFADDGTATFYTPPYVPSSCYGFQNEGVMIAAASDTIWDNRGACGRKYRVTCTGATNRGVPHPCNGNSVVVTIVDYCPPPNCRGTIDLSQEAFASIANPDAGKILVAYEVV